MGTGLDHPVSWFLGGIPGKNVTVNIKFDVIVNTIDLFLKCVPSNNWKSLMNKSICDFVKKFTFSLKFWFLGSIIMVNLPR